MRLLGEGTKDLFRLEWLELLVLASVLSFLVYVLGEAGFRNTVLFWTTVVVFLVHTGFAWFRWQLRKREFQKRREAIASLLEVWDAPRGEPEEGFQELPPHSDVIDALYVDLRHLQAQEVTPQREEKIRELLQQLRQLQKEEAEWMQRRFEASLHLKPGEGWRALDAAERFLKHEDLAPSNLPATREN
jgi:hypothetical protein